MSLHTLKASLVPFLVAFSCRSTWGNYCHKVRENPHHHPFSPPPQAFCIISPGGLLDGLRNVKVPFLWYVNCHLMSFKEAKALFKCPKFRKYTIASGGFAPVPPPGITPGPKQGHWTPCRWGVIYPPADMGSTFGKGCLGTPSLGHHKPHAGSRDC